ncbi:MAG: bifunctional aspartate kinase/homoserine dehydrogenase I [Rikenellaceae bacterium]
MKVLKFGGSSVGNPERIKNVAEIVINSYRNNNCKAVVFSAFQGITNSLIEMSTMAATGSTNYLPALKDFETRHFSAVTKLISVKYQSSVFTDVKIRINELTDFLHGVYLIKELSPKTLDYIMSFGERLSAFIICESIKDRGINAEFLDSRLLVKCDESFGSGKVFFEETNKNITEYFNEHKQLQIITGFIASTKKNETITLGRGGSDYTASIFGAVLNAEEIEVWTDVDGVMTADPRKVKRAFSISFLTYDEAMEMSHFGAKVIYPQTMQPAMDKNIPIRIKNTFNPSFFGTVIGKSNGGENFPIKGISSIDDISILLIQGSGLIGVAGISKRLFGALANGNINVILISQASSEHSICVAILPENAVRAKKLIEEEFIFEIQAKIVNEVVVENNLSIVAVVGDKMQFTPGNAGKIFQALGKNGINIVAIAQGSSKLDVSAVISKNDEAKALNAIHDAFFLSGHKSINLFVVGTGLIGRTLFRQIQNQLDFLSTDLMIEIKIIAMSNSRKMMFDTNGLSLESWENQLLNSPEQMKLDIFVNRMKEMNLPNSIFIDCTSSEQLLTKYSDILGSSISIVTPNKKANSSNYDFYVQLKQLAHKYNVKFLYETNVGAGLPIISTLHDLVASGDKVLKIEGVLSGTLSYIFNTFDGSKSFSQIVKGAQQKGFTEPDPRDDLNGLDVVRKLLILVREAGYKLEMNDIKLESLIPKEMNLNGSIPEFYNELEKYDSVFEEKRKTAQESGKVLRYIAKYENGEAEVSLKSVERAHPFYSLHSNDNIISFKTIYYFERPIVIQGPGAGAEVTSGGIFADIIRIGNFLS